MALFSLRSTAAAFCALALLALPAQAQPFTVETVADGLDHPWGMEVLPSGDVLVTERTGQLRRVSPNGRISLPIAGVPRVYNEGQGGLLDVALAPDFADSGKIFLSYAEGNDEKAGTAVASATLSSDTLEDVRVIFRQYPKVEGGNHFGSRLAFAPDGNLFITLGERFDYRDQVQKLDNHLGKIVRLHPDGSIPDDNPYVGSAEALPEIWSYGHRNIQGAAIHPKTGKLWIHEHGPRGGDEINLPRAGGNYGWPEASYGIHYWMMPIKDDHAGQGFIEPIYHWTPSIAPSGMLFYTGNAFTDWQGNVFVGALAGQHLARLTLGGETVLSEENLLSELKVRIRDVAQDAQGNILLLTDSSNGTLLKLKPSGQ